MPVLATINATAADIIRPQAFTTQHTDWEEFCALVDQSVVLNDRLRTKDELDTAVDAFTEASVTAARYSTPPMPERKSAKLHYPLNIRELVRQRKAARKKWQRTRLPTDGIRFNVLNQKLTNLRKLRNDRLVDYLSSISPTKDVLQQKQNFKETDS